MMTRQRSIRTLLTHEKHGVNNFSLDVFDDIIIMRKVVDQTLEHNNLLDKFHPHFKLKIAMENWVLIQILSS